MAEDSDSSFYEEMSTGERLNEIYIDLVEYRQEVKMRREQLEEQNNRVKEKICNIRLQISQMNKYLRLIWKRALRHYRELQLQVVLLHKLKTSKATPRPNAESVVRPQLEKLIWQREREHRAMLLHGDKVKKRVQELNIEISKLRKRGKELQEEHETFLEVTGELLEEIQREAVFLLT